MSKFKILKDFQLTTEDKKIVILKAKVFINDYVYSLKDVTITLDPLVVENNPDYFQFIDWKTDFINFLKTNKIAQPSVIAKKLFPYIEENFKAEQTTNLDDKTIILLESNHKKELENLTEKHLSIVKDIEDNHKEVLSNITIHNPSLDLKLEEFKKTNTKLTVEHSLSKKIIEDLNDKIEKLETKLKDTTNDYLKSLKIIEDNETKIGKLEDQLNDNSLVEDLQSEIRELKKVLNEKSKGVESIDRLYKTQIEKLELQLTNAKISKSQYSQEAEEEMILKLKDINERIDAVIKRESEVRSQEFDLNNTISIFNEDKSKNDLKLLEIETRDAELKIRLNDIEIREKQAKTVDIQTLIDKAISDYEKGIPWQYHRK